MSRLTAQALALLMGCGLVFGLAWAQAPAKSSLSEEVRAVEQLPSVQAERALALLEDLQNRAQPGSADALWILYQRGVWIAVKPKAKLALIEALDPAFEAWSAAADPERKPLAALARELVQIRLLMNSARYKEAQAKLTVMTPAQIAALPSPWNFLKGMSQGGVLEETGEIDQALPLLLDAIGRAPSDKARASALAGLSFTYLRLGQQERAEASLKEALQLVKANPTDESLMQAYNSESLVLSYGGDLQGSRQASERALALARKLNDRSALNNLLGNLSDTYLRIGNYSRALEMASEALPLATELEDRGGISLALHNGGIAKIHLKRVAEGEADVRRAIAMDLEQGGTTYAATSFEELGVALEAVGRLEPAMQAFTAYRDLFDKITRTDRNKELGEAQARFDIEQRRREAVLLQQRTALKEEAIRTERLRFGVAGLGLAVAAALAVVVLLLAKRLRHTNSLLAATNKELAAQSERDALTGLGNRRRLAQLLDAKKPEQASLFMIDIDHFKMLNDQFGHAGGDAVLVAVAGRLKGAVREPLGAIRWGGEEFLLVVRDIDADMTEVLAQRLLLEIGGQVVALRDGRSARVTASIGYARVPLEGLEQALDLERAVDLVDALMYQAKSHGRNQAWGLLAAKLPDADAVREALTQLPEAEQDGRLLFRRFAGPDQAGQA
ncbi:MAG: diguanylate cyclase [Burkholderiales bacterium]